MILKLISQTKNGKVKQYKPIYTIQELFELGKQRRQILLEYKLDKAILNRAFLQGR